VRTKHADADPARQRAGPAPDDEFAHFYSTHYASTKRLAYLLTGSIPGAEDVTHEAFAAVYPRFAGLGQPSAYLRTVTVNLCRRLWRRRATERARLARLGVDDVVMPSETAELLSGVRSLPPRQQEVLVLRYWARMSDAEIATTLRRPIGTVKSLHHRAIANLRKEFS